ncbi:hypothetical protein CBR56_24505 [Bacillus thuringiensis]|uniref:DUF4062 domain-containing protein n=1 Tax=Bacillus tropicus TaxID=2026188 RepID=UPI000B446264|nr:DUF4062 domain-containing protein [Bacillus tropicus]MED3036092.1 DUF4062 domain-containing protein [Bacillus tropicus]OTX77179.1 hypothetical protein BK728_24300 [Bacillus thuringiensis serovar chanpaisis]PNK24224.1 hypothetical protein CBR56_24505 [Bacillus thuringiensis]
MKKKLQVFVSSTYLDLKEERQKAVESILRARHIPAGMELFTAANKSQWPIIEEWIKESDVLMLIFGGKYGSVDSKSGKSYTQLEYEFALKHNIPVFAIVLDDQYLANKKSKNLDLAVYERDVPKPKIKKYEEFKKMVTSNLVRFISNIDQIATEVTLSLQNFIEKDNAEYHFRGWVRPSEMVNTNPLAEKRKQHEKLFEKDEALLSEILKRIEEEELIDIIENINHQCALNYDWRNTLREFVSWSEKPSIVFFNNGLQNQFEELIASIEKYLLFLGTHFFTIRGMPHEDRVYLYPDLNIDFSDVDPKGQKIYEKRAQDLFKISGDTIANIRLFVQQSQITLYTSN